MDKLQLEQKWNNLMPGGPEYKSLRIDSDCVPDLFVGIYNITTRCLILKLPEHHRVDFQSTKKTNLSLEHFRDTKWIILKLLDNSFIDLFDDLILSIYGRIYNTEDAGLYCEELISTFYRWSEFFNDKTFLRLSEETIRGIFGELFVLKEYIGKTDSIVLNDLLNSWKGPYNNRHDIILPQKDLEVKTMEDKSLSLVISSEFQLLEEQEKALELIVVRIRRESSGISLSDLVMNIRQMVISKLADFSIILKGLSAYGLHIRILHEYNEYRYQPVAIDNYDCMPTNFPKIIPSTIPSSISKVSYQIRVSDLKNFLISSKII